MRHLKIVLLFALALATSVALAACGGGSDGTTTGTGTGTNGAASAGQATDEGPGAGEQGEGAATTIVVKNGEPVGGVQDLEYKAGEQVRFTVDSDVADEVHVHGYDLMKDVAAGGSVSFSFPAEIEGIFEVELEEHGEQIAELRVNP
jgi:plastocyanin